MPRADRTRAPPAPPPRRGPQEGQASTSSAPTARARSPSSTRTTAPSRIDAVVVSTQHVDDVKHKTLARGDHRATSSSQAHPEEAARQEDQVPHQPDRPLRRRRADGRLRPHRPQDHRRHLRRHGPSRRRRLLRQGPVEGRPLGRVLRALHRQEHRRGGARAAAARCSSPTPSASPSRSRSGQHLRHRRRSTTTRSPRLVREHFDCRPGALIERARPAPPDLPARPPPTATSAAPRRTSPGSRRPRSPSSPRAPAPATACTSPLRRPASHHEEARPRRRTGELVLVS